MAEALNETVEIKVENTVITLREMPKDVVSLMKAVAALDNEALPQVWCAAAKMYLKSRGFIDNEGNFTITF